MFKYIIKRIVNYVIMLFVAVSMTYFLASAFMDPRSNYMSRNPHPPIASINRSLDLANINDQTPVVIRYFRWLKGILAQWNWGLSPDQSPVAPAIASRISASLQLVTLATVLSILFGVSIGVYTAIRQYKWQDRVLNTTATFFLVVRPDGGAAGHQLQQHRGQPRVLRDRPALLPRLQPGALGV